MANCYICGKKHAEYRRTVFTGTSYRTSYTRRGPSFHTYDNYGKRSVCGNCALDIDYKNKKISFLFILSITFAPLGIVFSLMKFGNFFIIHKFEVILCSILLLIIGTIALIIKKKQAEVWYEENRNKYIDSVDVTEIKNTVNKYKLAVKNEIEKFISQCNQINKNGIYCLESSRSTNDFRIVDTNCIEAINTINKYITQIDVGTEDLINQLRQKYRESDELVNSINECRETCEKNKNELLSERKILLDMQENISLKLKEQINSPAITELASFSTMKSKNNAIKEQDNRSVNAFKNFFQKIENRIIELDHITKEKRIEFYQKYLDSCNEYGFNSSTCSIFDLMKFDLFATIILLRFDSSIENLKNNINIMDKVLCYCPNINIQALVNKINTESKKEEINLAPNALIIIIAMIKKAQEIKPINDGMTKDGHGFVAYEYLKIIKTVAKDFFEFGIIKPSTEEITRCEKFFKTIGSMLKDELKEEKKTPFPKNNEINNRIEMDKSKTLQESLEELNSLIGLEKVKEEVNDLINLVKIKKIREQEGLNQAPMSLHLVFSGNPGTGKTTVARIIANIYKELGILSQGQLLETDRSDLVAGYIGQTAIKTREIIKKAEGGVLFIDEAYSLTSSKNENDFGLEAIDTILKAMEDMRNNFVVIVAGYPELMKSFLKSNPGLESRFNIFINFDDYTPSELFKIFVQICKKNNYRFDSSLDDELLSYFEDICLNKNNSFANARTVRNFFEKAIKRQAGRVAQIQKITKNELIELKREDLFN